MTNLYAHVNAAEFLWSGFTGVADIYQMPKNLVDALLDKSFEKEIPTLHVWSPRTNKHIHFEMIDYESYFDGKLMRWEFAPVDAPGVLRNLRIYISYCDED